MREIGGYKAGALIAELSRTHKDKYRFTIERKGGEQLRPSDLPDLIKLGELIAFAVLDDGWSSEAERDRIRNLYRQLEQVCEQ